MALKKLTYISLLLLCQVLCAQNDTITQLEEVIISDTQLRDFSNSRSILKLNDSIIDRNATSLGALLNYNTTVYFKENGLGMVSSPSFRGTTAQQTAVIWNGININSQLNGQTDFNIVNARDFNSVTVRAGGGSVIYGSSAIGGSIHLNNNLSFAKKFSNKLLLSYGSYATLNANYNMKIATNKFSSDVSISRNSSNNDYKYPDTDIVNENGEYYNTSYNAAFGYKVNDKNTLRLYSYAYDGDRHFSRTLSAPSQSKYHDTNSRNLLEWLGKYNRFTSKLKVGLLTEHYKYYARGNENYDFGKVNTWLGKYDLAYMITDDIKINTLLDYTFNKGEGTGIHSKERNIGSGSLLLQHAVTQKFQYEVGVRKEITDVYESPLLFSFGGSYKVSRFYKIKANASRNFRIPTFNDLYWQSGGNPDLNPESSYQVELGNEFRFKNTKLTLTGYYIKLRDMLRWTPVNNIWRPENVGKVNTYGIESILNWQKTIGSSRFTFDGTYAYTVSREDGKTNQLIYVPFHKATASLAYSYKKISAYYRHLYNGKVFFTSDNLSKIDAYNVSTFGVEYHFKVLQGLGIGAQVHNLWDVTYQNVNSRPMPGRNYTMYLNFKF
ncbi:MAG: TonB-dependent receptor [Flavobacterium sp. MedPE-SWcel]|uniref:TonB-dependent receptor plug domain-containing protein n=1 Tax=uncultured Flavobacterium sp. TaxID=165435 RepID=UPI000916276A|nr:TonB-dependent receptor [uncultured Flavobacterium sp.]OIQ22229.1 MAG: TonB-dependent receptor [Flavobacterium sp. MedPE-SWcel]